MVPQVYTYAKGVPLLLNLTIMSPPDTKNITLQYIEVQKENIIVNNKGQTRNQLNYNQNLQKLSTAAATITAFSNTLP